MIQANIHGGRFVLVNESTGGLCILGGNTLYGVPRYVSSRSACYRARQKLSRSFPECVYAVYELVRRVR